MDRLAVEIAVQSPQDALAACQLGADRVELCAAVVGTGGLTPSAAAIARTVEVAAGFGTKVHVLVRPRPGGFVYSRDEWETIAGDAVYAVSAGADGVVVGGCTPDGRLDSEGLGRVIEQVRQCGVSQGRRVGVTLHRVFDVLADPLLALEQAAGLGCDRVLTSGGAATAVDGIGTLQALAARAAALPLTLLVGGGVRAADVPALRAGLPLVGEVHAACTKVAGGGGEAGPGGGGVGCGVLDVQAARELIAAAHGTAAAG